MWTSFAYDLAHGVCSARELTVKVVVRVLARPQAPNRGVYSYGLMWARAAGMKGGSPVRGLGRVREVALGPLGLELESHASVRPPARGARSSSRAVRERERVWWLGA